MFELMAVVFRETSLLTILCPYGNVKFSQGKYMRGSKILLVPCAKEMYVHLLIAKCFFEGVGHLRFSMTSVKLPSTAIMINRKPWWRS